MLIHSRRVCSSRSAAETGFNRFSSRSHSIIRILVCRSDSRRESSNRVEALIGQIQFVDLAGSESSRGVKMDQKIKAGPESIMKRMKQRRDETNSINKSLSMLSRVIEELNKKSVHLVALDPIQSLIHFPKLSRLSFLTGIARLPAS